MPESEDPRIPLAHERTDLAYDRNRWAAERTLLAWMRTSLAMVSLGFAIDKFFAFLQQQEVDVRLDQIGIFDGVDLLFGPDQVVEDFVGCW